MDPLMYGRILTGVALAIHILLAVPGIGLPLFIVVAHYLGLRHRDPEWLTLANQWTRVFAVLFPMGALTGTIMPVLLVVLWPAFMQVVSEVGVLPMFIEGFAFFFEAIFLGLYLYGRDRLRPWVHWATSLPLVVASAGSAFLITTVNAWMQTPVGLVNGKVVDPDPVRAMFNPSTWVETSHVLVTAYLTVAFLVASLLAWQKLRGAPASGSIRKGITLALLVGFFFAVATVVTGDLSAKSLATRQPLKLAAIEALFETQGHAPLTIGGWPSVEAGQAIGGLQIPSLLSFLAHGRADAVVQGLRDFPRDYWPPLVVHLTFDLMVGLGFLLMAIPLVYWIGNRRIARRSRPAETGAEVPPMLGRRWFGRVLVAGGPLALLAIESGWLTTELGRQPWIIYEQLTVAAAFTSAQWVPLLFWLLMGAYVFIVAMTVILLRRVLRIPGSWGQRVPTGPDAPAQPATAPGMGAAGPAGPAGTAARS